MSRLFYTNRLACEFKHGAPAQFMMAGKLRDMYALHACDNAACMNPDHLHWGTHQDNTREKRDRLYTHVRQKLTPEQAYDIKYNTDRALGCTHVAKLYGVSKVTVSHIWHGRQWRHL